MSVPSKIHPIDPRRPSPELIRIAADLIAGGGAVIFPTTGLYGLGVHALKPEAVDRVFQIKGRTKRKPILVLIDRPSCLDRLVAAIPAAAKTCMERFWPGGLTLVFDARPDLPAGLTASTGKIGIRMAAHPACIALIQAAHAPITGTSANLSGQKGPSRIAEIDSALITQVDLVLDAGPLPGGDPSTIVDISAGRPVLIREGRVPFPDILAALEG